MYLTFYPLREKKVSEQELFFRPCFAAPRAVRTPLVGQTKFGDSLVAVLLEHALLQLLGRVEAHLLLAVVHRCDLDDNGEVTAGLDRKSTRLNSVTIRSRMPSSA